MILDPLNLFQLTTDGIKGRMVLQDVKNLQVAKVSTFVYLDGLHRLTWVDTFCRCFEPPFCTAWLIFQLEINFSSLPNSKILEWSKLKRFAGGKINVT